MQESTQPSATAADVIFTTRSGASFDDVLVLEDDRSTAERQRCLGEGGNGSRPAIRVRLHRISGSHATVVAENDYAARAPRSGSSLRLETALGLLRSSLSTAQGTKSVVVAGASFGSSWAFLEALSGLELPFVVEIPPSRRVSSADGCSGRRAASDYLTQGTWETVSACSPDGASVFYQAADLGSVDFPSGTGNLFAAQVGGIGGIHKGTIMGISSFSAPLPEFVRLVAYARWIRVAVRRARRETEPASGARPSGGASAIRARANIALARKQDAESRVPQSDALSSRPEARGSLRKAAAILNVVELFAGAGGMGLGFLLAGGPERGYRIVHSGEAHPIFVETLRANHRTFDRRVARNGSARTPDEVAAADLRESAALDEAAGIARDAGGAHVVIGGPPCQGFSSANRNSWSRRNPNNELIDVFVGYIERLSPLAFLMENVQGILWTQDAEGTASVVDVIEKRLNAAGYVLFPKLLDAAWYGVPQNRTRFFLMGLHRDLGYGAADFGDEGPYPTPTHGIAFRPTVSVRDAIPDLPEIGNGCLIEESTYAEPTKDVLERNEFLRYVREGSEPGVVFDHVTSRHAEYVIDRYRRIPEGGNWESIRDDLTNYADVSRTHSNIYRRLRWDEPAITIGHYRKSMLIHPSQHRGLSLREATRLQSFPDWFRFAGSRTGVSGGLMHKQQQLANAVSPLVTRAIADHMLEL